MPNSRQKSFAYPFDPSSFAASFVGPKQNTPDAVRSSASPDTSGPSGPTTTRSIDSARQNAITFALLDKLSGTVCATVAQPGFPGATNRLPIRGDLEHARASACSRAPDPRINTFIVRSRIFLFQPWQTVSGHTKGRRRLQGGDRSGIDSPHSIWRSSSVLPWL